MWCCCCTPKEELVENWETQMSDIISNVKRTRRLGVRYVEKLQFDRQSERDESEIVECFTSVDHGLLNAKLIAIQYLLSNSTLRNQCSEKLEFYKFYARKQLDIFDLTEEIEQLKLDNCMLKAENEMLKNHRSILQKQGGSYKAECKNIGEGSSEEEPYENEEINQVILLTRQQYEKMPKKGKEMRANLEKLIASYDAALEKLKSRNLSSEHENRKTSSSASAHSWSMQEQENRSLLKIQPGPSHVENRYYTTSKKNAMSRILDALAKEPSESKSFKHSSNIELHSLKNDEEDV